MREASRLYHSLSSLQCNPANFGFYRPFHCNSKGCAHNIEQVAGNVSVLQSLVGAEHLYEPLHLEARVVNLTVLTMKIYCMAAVITFSIHQSLQHFDIAIIINATSRKLHKSCKKFPQLCQKSATFLQLFYNAATFL